MKRFILHILLFLVFPLGICLAILFSPLNRKFALNSLPTDCEGRGSWIWSRIYSDTNSIDIAFLGTSHTINGIQDTMIQSLIQDSFHQKLNVVNLGYCRFGNEMQYIIAKDLFSKKKPKMIFIEINEEFGTASHPVYPYYAETKDLIQPASYFQQAYPANLYNGFLARLSQFRSEIFNAPDTILPSNLNYGYRGYPLAGDPVKLVPPEEPESGISNGADNFGTRYPRKWITQLVELCHTNKAQVCFLYLPSYHDQAIPIEGMKFYSSLASVMVPPPGLLIEKALWRDSDHLNDAGAGILATWIFETSPMKK